MRSKRFTKALITFLVILSLAAGISALLSLFTLTPLLHGFIVIATTKILVDVAAIILRRGEQKYLFFEDYLRETFLFFAVMALCVLAISQITRYIGGQVWFPLLAAAGAVIWR